MKNILPLTLLIVAGELIFSLPFHVSRFFRPSLLEDYNYSNMELGTAFSIYGVTALLSYMPGGYIADKISPKYLLFASLLLTSIGGIFFMTNPSINDLYFLFGYWGITTILFFWAALIKATQFVAGSNQGISFGALEAGRGLVASITASIAVIIYSNNSLIEFISEVISKNVSPISTVIFFYSFFTFFSSLTILFFFRDTNVKLKNKKKYNFKDIYNNKKPILCISIIVLSAYTCYKAIDYYSLYFYEVLKYSKEQSAFLMTVFSYARPISALLAGYIADKISPSKCTKFLFLFLLLSYLVLAALNVNNQLIYILYVNLIISMLGVFALRGIFYSLLKDANIPSLITGIAVGIVSFIGYMPDIYIGPIAGYLLESYNIIIGFKVFFVFLFLISAFGFATSIYLKKNI